MFIFPLHDFWSIVTKETGDTKWIFMYSPKTGNLKRRWDHNYCHYKKQANRIQLLLVTFLHQSISPHIQGHHIMAANRETSLHWRVQTLPGVDCCNRALLEVRTFRKREAGKSGRNLRGKGQKSKRNQALLSTGCTTEVRTALSLLVLFTGMMLWLAARCLCSGKKNQCDKCTWHLMPPRVCSFLGSKKLMQQMPKALSLGK